MRTGLQDVSVNRTRAVSPYWLRGRTPDTPQRPTRAPQFGDRWQHEAGRHRHYKQRGSATARPGGTRALRTQRPAPPCAHVTEPGRASAARSPQRRGGGAPFPPPRRAEQRREKVMAQAQGFGRRYLKAFFKGFFVAVPVTVTFLDRVACVARVEGASMQPSLNPGGRQASDVVLLNHWSIRNYDVQRGDIVSLVDSSRP
uniref:Mitochondrial inner membrane protease subunit 2 n=1 Tax=Phasianus colchicus TaxID=9054 RepID=A0A669P194_PHACC